MTQRSKFHEAGCWAIFILALIFNCQPGRAAANIDFGPTGAEASSSNPDGTWINLWGPAYVSTTFDPANPPPTGDTTGSIYNQGDWTGDTSGMDDYNMISPGTWWDDVVFDASQYASIELDIKYDTNNSTMTPVSAPHLNIGFDTGYNFVSVTNESFDSATSLLADGNWHHLSIPIPPGLSGVSEADGVSYYQWNPGGTSGTMDYWMANVQLLALTGPLPPPTLTPPLPATPGLNVFASTEDNSYYDRQEAELQQENGLSWVGQATAANPVTYTFTINGFPSSPATYGCEAYLFLVPNPEQLDNAPDWVEPDCAQAYLQLTSAGATMYFQYKVNDPYDFGMYGGSSNTVTTADTTNNYFYVDAPGSLPDGPITNEVSPGVFNITGESGALASVSAATALGTWTIQFTSNTNGALMAPDGSTTNFLFPIENAGYFAETQSPDAFNVFLGMEANLAGALNQSVDYASFSIANTATPFSENFLTDTALDTTNTWDNAISSGPAGVLVVPATAPWWLQWTLPDSGFSLETGPSLSNFSNWTEPVLYPPIPLVGLRAQLVDQSELPPGNAAWFILVGTNSP